MQHIPVRVLAARAARDGAPAPVPFATVVTDFTTCHNTWFYPGVNKCFVPTEFCKRLGLAMGLREQQLVVHGLPIRPTFSKKVPCRKKLRKQLVRRFWGWGLKWHGFGGSSYCRGVRG